MGEARGEGGGRAGGGRGDGGGGAPLTVPYIHLSMLTTKSLRCIFSCLLGGSGGRGVRLGLKCQTSEREGEEIEWVETKGYFVVLEKTSSF